MQQEMQNLPTFEGHNFFYHGAYEGENGCVTHGFAGVSETEAHAYLGVLRSAGFTVYTSNRFGDTEFYTMVCGEQQLRFAYFARTYLLKLYCTQGEELPAITPPVYVKKAPASITQIGRRGASQLAPGMSLIVQAEDGSFVIIDGGGHDEQDASDLLAYLREHFVGDGLPVISMWMITHPHPDHMALANYFIEKYAKDVDLRAVAYNFPDLEKVTTPKEEPKWAKLHIARFRKAVAENAPDAKTYVFHTGDVLHLPGLRMDFLFTHEDYYPHEFSWANYLSAAWMITGPTQTALILGDCDKPLCQQIASTYGEALKCDILQPTHHGFNGACMDLYRYADPTACFWAVNEERFLTDPRVLGQKKGYEFNAFLRNPSIKERTHYHNDITKTLLL